MLNRLSKAMLFAVACLASTALAIAQQPNESGSDDSLSPDEVQIRKSVIAFVEQYNAHDADKLAGLFATDARMVFQDGTEVNGTAQIEQAFADEFAERSQAAVSVDVDSIRFLTPDVAVEEGMTSLFPDGETLTSQGRYTVLHLKKDGRWTMQSVRVVEEESVSAYGALQPLEWLVGEWVDEGRDELVETKFRWDENKTYLLEEFQIVQDGKVVIKGTQRIGWDPQAKQIRSWTFDDAGGFGDATWTPVGEMWVCKVKGIDADGTSVSATRTLSRATSERVIWRATERLAGNEQLPDLATTMVRKPPAAESE